VQMSNDCNHIHRELWERWDGTDADTAHKIWKEFSMSVSGTVASLVEMKRIAETESGKLFSLLQLNECPYLMSVPATVCKEHGTSVKEECTDCKESTNKKAECMVALYLSLFDSLSDFIYSCLKPSLVSMEGVPRSIAGLDYFCRLTWTFHCLMVFLPTKFPEMRRRFLLSDVPRAHTVNMLDAIAIIPGNINQCLESLPFTSLSCVAFPRRNGEFFWNRMM
jgi:hypothetical protein